MQSKLYIYMYIRCHRRCSPTEIMAKLGHVQIHRAALILCQAVLPGTTNPNWLVVQ